VSPQTIQVKDSMGKTHRFLKRLEIVVCLLFLFASYAGLHGSKGLQYGPERLDWCGRHGCFENEDNLAADYLVAR